MTLKLKGRAAYATPERVARFVQIIGLLKDGNLSMADISKGCKLGKTTAGKYVYDMRQNDIIHYVGVVGMRRHYRLNPREGVVDSFVAAITAPEKEGQPNLRGNKPTSKLEGVHVMHDDEVFKVKRATWKIPQHTELMQAFFGIASLANKEVQI